MEWTSSTSALLKTSSIATASVIPRARWIPPRSKPRAKRASAKRPKPRTGPASKKPRKAAPKGLKALGGHDSPADVAGDDSERSECSEYERDDADEALELAGGEDEHILGAGFEDGVVDALWDELRPAADGEYSEAEEQACGDDDDHAPGAAGAAGAAGAWTPGLSEGKVLAEVCATIEENLVKSVESLRHRSDALVRMFRWPCTAADTAFAKSMACDNPVVASSKVSMEMCLLEDIATGTVSPWHWVRVETALVDDPPVIIDPVRRYYKYATAIVTSLDR